MNVSYQLHGLPHAFRGRGPRRVALALFFGSVCVNAALGIAGLVAGDFDETEGKLLATSLSVTGALLLALLCMPAWERGLLGLVPPAAAAAGLVGFALVIGAVWTSPASVYYGKAVGTLFVVAGAGVLASLLVLATLPPRHAVVFTTALALTSVLAVAVVTAFWLEVDESWFLRGLGVVLVVLAALVVTIPVLYRLDRATVATTVAHAEIAFCPYCGGPIAAPDRPWVTCPTCRRTFAVREESRASRT